MDKRIKQYLFLLLAILQSTSVHPAEQVTGFTVKPDRCIALNQGQLCYQHLDLEWQTEDGEQYCLYQQNLAEPVVCWSGREKSSYQLEFVSDTNIIYQIRVEGQRDVLSQVEVEVAWVYRSTRKSFSRWRLF